MDFKESGESIIYREDLQPLGEIFDKLKDNGRQDEQKASSSSKRRPFFRLPKFNNTQTSLELNADETAILVGSLGDEARRNRTSYETHLYAIDALNRYYRTMRAERYRRPQL